MTIPEILEKLERYTRRFPRDALQAAIEQREAIVPELMRALKSAADAPAEWAERKDNMLPLFAIFLLAQFREKSAYPLLARIVSAPGETPFELFGDTICEGLSRILASVYDDDPAPLRELVESEEVDEYVRSAALDTLLVLEHTDQMPRETVVEYFRSLFHGKLQRTPSFVWDALVCGVGDLPAPELLEEVRQAYAEGLADPGVANLPAIERNLAKSKSRSERAGLITDAIAEMEWWAWSDGDDLEPTESRRVRKRPDPEPTRSFSPAAMQPFVRDPKIGRNSPCPCGSGRKYKKCCGKG